MSGAGAETSDGDMDSIHSSEIGDILSSVTGLASYLNLDKFDST